MAYAFEKFDKASMARSSGNNLRISLKKTVETAKALQGKKVDQAIKYLERVIEQKSVVPYTRFNTEMPHKKGVGIAAGGYPVKVAEDLLILIKNAQKNAANSELGENLYIVSISARKGVQRYHNGRYFGRKMKATNVEVIVGVKETKKAKKEAKEVKQ